MAAVTAMRGTSSFLKENQACDGIGGLQIGTWLS
jgi:hypothetical protein